MPTSDDLLDALVQSSFEVVAVLQRAGAELDLSLTQVRVLGILRDREPPISVLADYLGLERSTMTGLVGRAETRGLLRRVPDAADRRSVRVTLTADGHAVIERLTDRVRAGLADRLTTLGTAEQTRLRALLVRMLGSDAL